VVLRRLSASLKRWLSVAVNDCTRVVVVSSRRAKAEP
jgi:hypothetical protein